MCQDVPSAAQSTFFSAFAAPPLPILSAWWMLLPSQAHLCCHTVWFSAELLEATVYAVLLAERDMAEGHASLLSPHNHSGGLARAPTCTFCFFRACGQRLVRFSDLTAVNFSLLKPERSLIGSELAASALNSSWKSSLPVLSFSWPPCWDFFSPQRTLMLSCSLLSALTLASCVFLSFSGRPQWPGIRLGTWLVCNSATILRAKTCPQCCPVQSVCTTKGETIIVIALRFSLVLREARSHVGCLRLSVSRLPLTTIRSSMFHAEITHSWRWIQGCLLLLECSHGRNCIHIYASM